MPFASDTAVRRRDETHWDAEIREGWAIAGNANGGYLLAVAARAVAEATGRPDPATITGHFLSPGRPGPVTVEAVVLRTGRRFATARATVSGADPSDPGGPGRPLVAVLGSFCDLEASGTGEPPPERVDAEPPDLPPVEECVGFEPPAGDGFARQVDMRLHPLDAGFARGRPSGVARVRGWFRLPGEEPVDSLGLLLATDSFPPTVFNAALPLAWTPTVELTTHVRARPAPGWLRCRFTTRFITGGFLEEDGEVWDATGRLVAQSRQLALVPRPPGDR